MIARASVNLADLDGQRFALWLVNGPEDQAVFGGFTARLENGGLFLHRPQSPPFEVRPEWAHRIRKVGTEDQGVRDILLNADYYLRLTVGPIPEGEDSASYLQTYLKWPEDEDSA
jgi:hypothetical protein